MITANTHKKVLVVATETLSKVTDYTDRTTRILFGDGTGAMLVEFDPDHPSFLEHHMGTDGSGGIHLSRTNLSDSFGDTPLNNSGKIVQNGREVYKWAVRTIPQGIQKLLDKAGYAKEDIQWFVPHSANLRMIKAICEKSDISIHQTLTSEHNMEIHLLHLFH